MTIPRNYWFFWGCFRFRSHPSIINMCSEDILFQTLVSQEFFASKKKIEISRSALLPWILKPLGEEKSPDETLALRWKAGVVLGDVIFNSDCASWSGVNKLVPHPGWVSGARASAWSGGRGGRHPVEVEIVSWRGAPTPTQVHSCSATSANARAKGFPLLLNQLWAFPRSLLARDRHDKQGEITTLRAYF